MKNFLVFTKKEIREQLYNYKLFIFLVAFFIFGMLGPLTAKLLPQIMSSMSINGMEILLPTPTYLDSYAQFFKNINQIGTLIILIGFSSCICGEISRGTLINLLSKGLSRNTIIISKYVSCLFLWTISYIVSSLAHYGYTLYLFGNHSTNNLFFSLFCVWLFGAFIISVLFVSSVLTKGIPGTLIISFAILGLLLILSIFPKLMKFNPLSLVSYNLGLMTNNTTISYIMLPIIITLSLIVFFIAMTLFLFRKKQL